MVIWEHEGNVENTSRWRVFSTFLECSQMTGVFYHSVMHLSMSSRRAGRRGIGRDFDRSLWPGGRAFEFSCYPGGRDIWIFVRARDDKSFLGVGTLIIFDLTFLPGGREFDSNLLENVKIPPPPRKFFHLNHLRIVRKRCSHSNFSSQAINFRPGFWILLAKSLRVM